MTNRHSRLKCGCEQRGFTLVELLVSIVVVAALMALLIVGLQAGGVFARKAATQQTLSALKQSVVQFETEFGFKVPLVFDGSEMGSFSATARGAMNNSGPVYSGQFNRPFVNVYQMGSTQGRAFLRGTALNPTGGNPDYRDPRFSKFSLAFYIAGALGATIDGVEGLGMYAPAADGSWTGVGDSLGGKNRVYEPFMDTGRRAARIESAYFDDIEQQELGGTTPGSMANRSALVDGNGKAFRYYRWLHSDTVGSTLDLNIPGVLLDPVVHRDALGNNTIDVTEGNASLRSATWAIVSAGANKVFGTEPIALLRSELGLGPSVSEAEVRRRAASDNVVEVGP
ncbi:MAG: type II secretion system protein [Phycisphaeraceae bacterium]|nr:type II secretion system protein [Phycisphaeraceae bacterium]MCW5763598.1 type II secretion system protein [Phycisphaeraceae bacterium]